MTEQVFGSGYYLGGLETQTGNSGAKESYCVGKLPDRHRCSHCHSSKSPNNKKVVCSQVR